MGLGENVQPEARTATGSEDEEFYPIPLPYAVDKYQEAHYFLDGLLQEYHHPDPFRWNLNAFLQALRSVTFILQSELAHRDGFKDWYSKHQGAMRSDELLRRFVEGRNIVVKQRMLTYKSRAEAGVFRGRELKLGISGLELDVRVSSRDHLLRLTPHMSWFGLEEDRSTIGEQAGIKRTWIVDELGEDEVVSLCHRAWVRIGKVLLAALQFAGSSMTFELAQEEGHHAHDVNAASVLLESDIDPGLPEKWGWTSSQAFKGLPTT